MHASVHIRLRSVRCFSIVVYVRKVMEGLESAEVADLVPTQKDLFQILVHADL